MKHNKKTLIAHIAVMIIALTLLAGCTPKAVSTSLTDVTTGIEDVTGEDTLSPEATDETKDNTDAESDNESETDVPPQESEAPSESEEPTESETEEALDTTEDTPTETTSNNVAPPQPITPVVPPQPNVQLTYIDGILVVNKTYPLPSTYAPGYNSEAYSSLMTMFADAKNQGYTFWVASGYRSYYDQKVIYNNYVAWDGQAAADRYSARPGHSEHQTGLAFDLNYLTAAFGSSPEGIWLAQNCHKYGFIIRYPQDKEHITGYMYEPWHVRYLGVEKATAVYESGLCLEEYLGITSQYSY